MINVVIELIDGEGAKNLLLIEAAHAIAIDATAAGGRLERRSDSVYLT